MNSSSTKQLHKKTNHLSREKSPYLLQHATNPVDWYAWNEDSLRLAKEKDKPIFLSIGYSTCHWCHVMERECFEDTTIANFMNEHFINIKVDREERPDLDAVYMTVVQALTGTGGWPMSVWLTPDLKPFYGGTYFPPADRPGQPGFLSVLSQLNTLYENDRQKIWDASRQISSAIDEAIQANQATISQKTNANESIHAAFENFRATFDNLNGGFGSAPKFPMPAVLEFLLSYHTRFNQPEALRMVDVTLEKMIQGGIYDQLGGGFARYSTDMQWVVPHFEKMLYDNAQLISVLVDLFQLTRKPVFKDAARQSISYILRDMTHASGAFYSAEDADSQDREGAFYVWKAEEIRKVLSPEEADVAISYFGVTPEGNFYDPHYQERALNILTRSRSVPEIASLLGMTEGEINRLFRSACRKLFDARRQRPRPERDEKILTEWNALMISALAKASLIFQDENYRKRAEKAAGFLRKNLFDESTETLYRRWKGGEHKIEATLADYAALIEGLLDLFAATGDISWLEWAIDLEDRQNQLFADVRYGGYFMSLPSPDLIFRMKEESDNVIPSGNSTAALNGLRLYAWTGRPSYHDLALRTFQAFGSALNERPASFPKMLRALDFEANGHLDIMIIGPRERRDTLEFIRAVFADFLPAKVFTFIDPDQKGQVAKTIPGVGSLNMLDEKATALVCFRQTCLPPTNQLEKLHDFLSHPSFQIK